MTEAPCEVGRSPSPRTKSDSSRSSGLTPSVARLHQVRQRCTKSHLARTTVAPTVRMEGSRFHPSGHLAVNVVDRGQPRLNDVGGVVLEVFLAPLSGKMNHQAPLIIAGFNPVSFAGKDLCGVGRDGNFIGSEDGPRWFIGVG